MAEYILCKDIDTPKSPIIPPPSPSPSGGLPSGGTTGQALVKKSNASGDVEWKTIGEGSAILYPTTGQNTDGAMTQKATTDALALKADAATVTTQLADKADKSTVNALVTDVADKADQTDLDALSSTVANKADKSTVDSLAVTVSSKANQSAVDALSSQVANKADKTDVPAPEPSADFDAFLATLFA